MASRDKELGALPRRAHAGPSPRSGSQPATSPGEPTPADLFSRATVRGRGGDGAPRKFRPTVESRRRYISNISKLGSSYFLDRRPPPPLTPTPLRRSPASLSRPDSRELRDDASSRPGLPSDPRPIHRAARQTQRAESRFIISAGLYRTHLYARSVQPPLTAPSLLIFSAEGIYKEKRVGRPPWDAPYESRDDAGNRA
jgi:hypothetical protein